MTLPKGKRWRFEPEARARFDKSGGFQARQLNETGWLARIAKHYLAAVTDPYKIHVLPGKMTAMIRGKWGLNDLLPDHNYSSAKNRKDHRHHAIDALVAALTDRKLLHRMSNAYDEERQKIEIPLPWPTLREDLEAKLKGMIVSHKADHGALAPGRVREIILPAAARRHRLRNSEIPTKRATISSIARNFAILTKRRPNASATSAFDICLQTTSNVNSAMARTSNPRYFLFPNAKIFRAFHNGIRHVRLTKAEKPEYLVPIRGKSRQAPTRPTAPARTPLSIL